MGRYWPKIDKGIEYLTKKNFFLCPNKKLKANFGRVKALLVANFCRERHFENKNGQMEGELSA